MNIPSHFWVFWFILTTLAVTSARHFEGWESPATVQDIPSPPLHPLSSPALSRPRRSIGGFFTKIWTVGSLGKAQYDDTRSSLAKIYEMLRDSFSDTMVRKTVSEDEIILDNNNFILLIFSRSPQLLCNPGLLVMERRRPEEWPRCQKRQRQKSTGFRGRNWDGSWTGTWGG